MPQTFTKNRLSASTNGKNILVSGTTSGAAVTLHTAVSGTTNYDEIYIYAENQSTSNVDLTIEFGGTSTPVDTVLITIPAKAGPVLVIPGWMLQNALLVKAFASAANQISINGYVHNIVNT